MPRRSGRLRGPRPAGRAYLPNRLRAGPNPARGPPRCRCLCGAPPARIPKRQRTGRPKPAGLPPIQLQPRAFATRRRARRAARPRSRALQPRRAAGRAPRLLPGARGQITPAAAPARPTYPFRYVSSGRSTLEARPRAAAAAALRAPAPPPAAARAPPAAARPAQSPRPRPRAPRPHARAGAGGRDPEVVDHCFLSCGGPAGRRAAPRAAARGCLSPTDHSAPCCSASCYIPFTTAKSLNLQLPAIRWYVLHAPSLTHSFPGAHATRLIAGPLQTLCHTARSRTRARNTHAHPRTRRRAPAPGLLNNGPRRAPRRRDLPPAAGARARRAAPAPVSNCRSRIRARYAPGLLAASIRITALLYTILMRCFPRLINQGFTRGARRAAPRRAPAPRGVCANPRGERRGGPRRRRPARPLAARGRGPSGAREVTAKQGGRARAPRHTATLRGPPPRRRGRGRAQAPICPARPRRRRGPPAGRGAAAAGRRAPLSALYRTLRVGRLRVNQRGRTAAARGAPRRAPPRGARPRAGGPPAAGGRGRAPLWPPAYGLTPAASSHACDCTNRPFAHAASTHPHTPGHTPYTLRKPYPTRNNPAHPFASGPGRAGCSSQARPR